ncbi:hypothetical protein EV356DRAFT_455953, partial [Viridothelium virens]
NLNELCTTLVDDLYGGLTSQVFSILMRLGRASLPTLRTETRLPLRNLRNALAVLIQQHLCLWCTDEDGYTYYESDWYQAYALVQSGKIVKIVEERCGKTAGILVSNLLEMGHCKVGDLVSAYERLFNKNPSMVNADVHLVNGTAGTNGDRGHRYGNLGDQRDQASGQIQSVAHIHEELKNLLSKEFITLVGSNHFKPDADLHNEAVVEVQSKEFPDGVKGRKATAKYASALIRQKKKLRDGNGGTSSLESTLDSLKRKRSERDSPNKRPNPGGTLTNGKNELNGYVGHLDDDKGPILRVNYEKFNVVFRNEQLSSLCERYLGETTAKVYGTTLRCLENHIPRCYDRFGAAQDADLSEEEGDECDDEEHMTPSVTSYEVEAALDPSVDLKAGLGYVSNAHDIENGSRRQTSPIADLDDDDDIRVPQSHSSRVNGNHVSTVFGGECERLVRQHMGILREDPRHFIHWLSTRGGGEWSVDFNSITKYLIQTQIENTVTARFGREAARVIRVLHSKGKLDEKQVSKFGFFREKHVRTILTRLQEAGFLEVQEVPKDNARQPSRTIFLWFFDQDRCRSMLLNDTYQAMARLLQRAKFERERIKEVLDKAERTDVQGKEDRFLTEHERMALRRWSDVEETLLTQLGRQDDLVILFRDFIPIEAV